MAIPDPFNKLGQLYSLDGFDLILGLLRDDFRAFANSYFNTNRAVADHDNFFNRFTPVWLDLINKRHYFQATKLWNFALELAFDWQKQNRPNKIHKGTPYYFLGVTAILNNELENGFLNMHQAMREDQRSSGRRTPQTPAFWFITLDSSRQNQFFKLKVDQIAAYLSEKLRTYSTSRGGSLRLSDFRRRFLRLGRLREEVFFFVSSLFKLRKLVKETSKIYKKNIFSSLLHANLLFDFCLISDKAIEYRNPTRGPRPTYRDEMMFLSSPSIALLSFNQSRITVMNNDFDHDLSRTIYDILFGRYHLSLSDIENDFAITYGIRNFGAHKIQNQPVLYNRTPEIAQRILNTLFFTIEHLY